MTGRGPFSCMELELAAPLPLEAARAALAALAGLSRQPRLVLEARGEAGRVRWFIGGDAISVRRAVDAIRPHLPGLRTRDAELPPPSTAAAVVRFRGHKSAPLATAATEDVARSVLGALAGARRGELVRLQLILGMRHRPKKLGEVPPGQRTQLRAKYGEHRFSCELRVAARADELARARRLVGTVTAAMRPLEAPGVSLNIRRSSLAAVDEIRSPLIWPNELGISELSAMLGWPVGSKDAELPGVPPAHPRLLPVSPKVPSTGRVLGVSALDPDRLVAQGIEEAKRVTHVMGPIGTGKSTMLVNLALDDAHAGRSVVVIDGKGDTITDFLERLDPSRHDDVVVFDPTDRHPVGVDVFGGDPERSTDVILGTIKSLYGDELGPRSTNLLHAAVLTLARAGNLPLSLLPILLARDSVRRPIAARVRAEDPLGLGMHWAQFESLSEAERAHVIAPLRNKLDPFLGLRPSLRAMFGQARPRFSLRDVFMNPGKRPIVLISLGTAELGPEGARLMGSILLSLIWSAAQERTKLPQNQRHPVMLYLDEFQEITRLGDLADALGRARGLGVAFTLAHQSLTQLTPSTRQAVLAHARSRVCFQLSPTDARDIATTTNGVLAPADFQELPSFTAQASLLVNNERTPWSTIRTRPLPPRRQSAELVRARSRERYGRPIGEVEAELTAIGGWREPSAEDAFGRGAKPAAETSS